MKLVRVSLGLLFVTTPLFGWSVESAIAPIDCASRGVARLVCGVLPDASQQYQDMAQQAYDAMKVPVDRCLIVKNSALYTKDMYPCCQQTMSGTGVIAINEEALNKLSYGARRFCVFHAVCHVLYRDMAKRMPLQLVPLGVLVASPWLTKWFGRWLVNYPLEFEGNGDQLRQHGPRDFRFEPGNRMKFAVLWLAVATSSQSLVSEFIKKVERTLWDIREKRADTQAARTCDCQQCLLEAADARDAYLKLTDGLPIIGTGNNPFMPFAHVGLSGDDLRRWARQKNDLCEYHRAQKAEKETPENK